MADNKNERQEFDMMYKNLDASSRVIFKSILELVIVLLKNQQIKDAS